MKDYLVCYSMSCSGGKSGVGDCTMHAPDLSVKSLTEIRKWIAKDLRAKGFKAPSVTFTSVVKLDDPTGKVGA